MFQYSFLLLVLLSIVSCKNATEESIEPEKEMVTYEMYQPSEMTQLMHFMYAYHETVKKKILEGDTLHEFPTEFLTIHTAKLTKDKPHSDAFEAYAKQYINLEKALYNPADQSSVKDRYNTAITSCITCHKTECTGPILKIKKLFIK